MYQVLAGALIYPNDELRASARARAENRRGQRALWGQGISGDWPVVLATISDKVGLPSVRQLLVAHKYWRMKGVTGDLVILIANDPSYIQDLHDQIVSIVRSSSEGGVIDRPGGVFVRRTDSMPPEDVALLRATARPVTWCASRKGMPSRRTSQSAMSVAVEKPWPAAAAIASRSGVMSAIIPVMAARERSSASKASNTGGLSSCKSRL